MTQNWRRLGADLLAGAFWGGLLATMAKGVQIGWLARNDGWGWLSIPLGLISGPIYALIDVATLFSPADQALLVLDWTAMGGLIGAALGLFPDDMRSTLADKNDKDEQ